MVLNQLDPIYWCAECNYEICLNCQERASYKNSVAPAKIPMETLKLLSFCSKNHMMFPAIGLNSYKWGMGDRGYVNCKMCRYSVYSRGGGYSCRQCNEDYCIGCSIARINKEQAEDTAIKVRQLNVAVKKYDHTKLMCQEKYCGRQFENKPQKKGKTDGICGPYHGP